MTNLYSNPYDAFESLTIEELDEITQKHLNEDFSSRAGVDWDMKIMGALIGENHRASFCETAVSK